MTETRNVPGSAQGAKESRPRMANLELLRCIAMMMVVVLHYLSKGGLLAEPADGMMNAAQLTAWVLEVFCIVAVNVYMMISGYFLCNTSFKLSRLIKLWLQVWFYSVGVGMVAAVTGILPAEECNTHYFLSLLFPVSMGHYWFLTAYIFLYVALPLISMAVQRMTKGQMRFVVLALLFVFCLLKSVLPFRLEMDGQGYDCIWYLCVFMAAAYIRKFGVSLLKKRWQCILLYVGACLAMLAETLCLQQIYLKTGSLGRMVTVAIEYNHIFAFLAAVGLFLTFQMTQVSGKASGIINRVAPYTLGVYLLHENLGVRYAWQKWLWADRASGVCGVIFYTLTAMVIVFVIGIFADFIRSLIMKGLNRLLGCMGWYRKLLGGLEKADNLFREKKE